MYSNLDRNQVDKLPVIADEIVIGKPERGSARNQCGGHRHRRPRRETVRLEGLGSGFRLEGLKFRV